MTEKKGVEGAVDDLRRPLEPHAARVEGGHLRVDSPTRLPDGTEVPLDVCFEFDEDELTPDQRAQLARYEGRPYTGTVRNGRLLVDEPTALPDGVTITVVEDWPLPPEEQAKLDAALEQGFRDIDAGRGIPAEDVIEAMRIKDGLSPRERQEFEAEYKAECERRYEQAVPGGHITMRDFLARWKKSP